VFYFLIMSFVRVNVSNDGNLTKVVNSNLLYIDLQYFQKLWPEKVDRRADLINSKTQNNFLLISKQSFYIQCCGMAL